MNGMSKCTQNYAKQTKHHLRSYNSAYAANGVFRGGAIGPWPPPPWEFEVEYRQ